MKSSCSFNFITRHHTKYELVPPKGTKVKKVGYYTRIWNGYTGIAFKKLVKRP